MQDAFRKVLERSRVPNYYPTYSESIDEPKVVELSCDLVKKVAIDFATWLLVGVEEVDVEKTYDKFIKEYTNDD